MEPHRAPEAPVLEEQHGRVLTITINRENKRNAVDQAVADGLDGALNRLDDDPDLWVGILSGGPRMFSAGTDLTCEDSPVTERGGEYGLVRRHRTTPLIAAVEGLALGGGFELALACDLIVASADAYFGLPETRRGVIASSGGLFRVPDALPRNVATELLIAGGSLDARRATQFGLVNRLAEPGRAREVAFELAQEICNSSPYAVSLTLQALNTLHALSGDEAGWQVTKNAKAAVIASHDMQEGIAAFFDKRAPEWRGR